MTEIEKYAVKMLHEGGEGIAEDDLNEDDELSNRDHRKACDLSIDMAHAVRDNADSFLGWFRSVTK